MRYNTEMNRYARIAIIAGSMVLLAAGSAFASTNLRASDDRSPVAASHEPESSEPAESEQPEPSESPEPKDEATGAAPSQPELDRLVTQLGTAGIRTTDDALSALIAKYGVGGAVRVLAFAASGTAAADIEKMRDDGLGWGQIAQKLNADGSLNLNPGIGWIMSGGHGKGHAAGGPAAASVDKGANGRGHAGSH